MIHNPKPSALLQQIITRRVSFEVALLQFYLANHNPTRQRGTSTTLCPFPKRIEAIPPENLL
ncbi:hypothetical protein Pla52o_33610 [Novipirellula galeiformis]|uniref:Uncharacterized protein n=1 Tax=Novipirellula galeiformis TaxID=2528004 RepID=A0A5C6CE57_9BACT|nr:hypothetical protein Pla52o_33610 [Novipirellula galeiformis]